MGITRKPFQGVFNIIRFNWHFYLIVVLATVLALIFYTYIPFIVKSYFKYFTFLALIPLVLSLIVSYYVYDHSDLYELEWLPDLNDQVVLNLNAGFDETSEILKQKYSKTNLTICDFYNPALHTEVSIKRARKYYPPVEGTLQVTTNKLPFENNSFDYCIAIFSAHEIRDEKERIEFFKELNRITKKSGQIFVTEHLRDVNNFLAYSIGFFHFLSKGTWFRTFKQSNIKVVKVFPTNRFVKTFILENNGDSF